VTGGEPDVETAGDTPQGFGSLADKLRGALGPRHD
jgi:hypothetical protein